MVQTSTSEQVNLSLMDSEQSHLDAAYMESVRFYVSAATSNGEPRSYAEATHPENPQSPMWIKAIQEELSSLQQHGTWKVVPKPANAHVISCKWVWRIKLKLDDSIKQFKARLVAQGFSQKPGIDYNETFAPIARMDTIRLLADLQYRTTGRCIKST